MQPSRCCGPGWQSLEAELQNPAVRRSEEFLARVGRIAGVGGWEIDLVTRQPIWSAEARRIHGVAADYRPTLDSALEFFPPEALPSIIAAIEKSRQTGEGWDLELPLQRADGHRIWVRTVGETAFTGGQPVRVSGTIQDITDLVRERQAREEASERLSLATESGNIAIWDWDLVNRFVHWDPRMYRLHGIEPGSGVETYDQSVRAIHPDDIDAVKQMLRHAVRAGGTFDCEFRVVWPDDSIHYIKGLARVHRDADGRAIRMIGTNWDITEARRLAAKTAEQAEFLRVTLESIADAVMTCDAAGDITWLNPVAARMTGWPCSEALGRPLTEVCSIVTEETRLAVPNAAAICLAGAREVASTSHTLLIGRDGSAFGIDYTASPIRNDSGRVIGAVLVCHDVSEQQRLSREMSHRASHDGLTGLINRAAFDTRLSRLLRERKDEPHVMLYIDLDTFKVVNEACGHDAGDQLLRQISGLLSELVRTRDCVARLGGDEFGVLLERCSLSAGHQIAQKICDQIELFRFAWDGRRFRIGASIGVVPIDQRWDNAAAAVKAADSSCHAAKESGRHRVHVWEESDDRMKARQSEAQWVNRLESAMEDDRFILYGQRILPIDGPMRALHCEVLLRLKDVDGTLVLPSAFMPAAERFHLASRIDRWVLGRVFAQLSLPGAAMDRIETIAVNLSGQSMGDRRFQQDVIRMVGSAGFDVRKLCFEITETVAITNFAEAQRFIDEVRAFGVQIALDDFGAGASSFGYLRKLAVDVLKIDGQFITGLLDNPLDNAAVRCFCEVAKVVGAKTIAEFVERADVRQALCRLGVDMAQGYLMHRPEPLIGLLPRAA